MNGSDFRRKTVGPVYFETACSVGTRYDKGNFFPTVKDHLDIES